MPVDVAANVAGRHYVVLCVHAMWQCMCAHVHAHTCVCTHTCVISGLSILLRI